MPPRPRTGNRTSPNPATPAPGGDSVSLFYDIAHVVFLANEVREKVQLMNKMRPNSNAVLKSAGHWYTASEKMNDSIDEIWNSSINLGIYWEGKAYDAYAAYVEKSLIPDAQKNGEVLFEMGNKLVELHNQVCEIYNDAVNLFSQSLERVTQIHADYMLAREEADQKTQKQQLRIQFGLFMEGMVTRRTQVRSASTRNAAAITALRGQMQQLKVPGAPPSGMNDRKKWKYEG